MGTLWCRYFSREALIQYVTNVTIFGLYVFFYVPFLQHGPWHLHKHTLHYSLCMHLASTRLTHLIKTSVVCFSKRCHTCAAPSWLLLYNGTVAGCHHYEPCPHQSKNTAQDSSSMWRLWNCREQERAVDHRLSVCDSSQTVWQSDSSPQSVEECGETHR